MSNFFVQNMIALCAKHNLKLGKLAELVTEKTGRTLSSTTLTRLAKRGAAANPSDSTVAGVASVFKVAPEEMLHKELLPQVGKEVVIRKYEYKTIEEEKAEEDRQKTVPLLTEFDLSEVSRAFGIWESNEHKNVTAPEGSTLSQDLIAFYAPSNALAPEIRKGFLVYATPMRTIDEPELKDGSLVLAKTEGGEQVLRKLILDDVGNKWLVATNKNQPGSEPLKAEEILAVVYAWLGKPE